MTEKLTVELPAELAQRLRALAAQARRPLEEMLVEYIDQAVSEPPVEALGDSQLLALCDLQLAEGEQEELSDLLDRNREGALGATDRQRLDELMRQYRRGWVRKGQAVRAAVVRGLKARLN